MTAIPERNRPGPWRQELHAFVRAFSGAFLFGIPLLFTMEMWWIGTYAEVWKLLVFLAVAFGVNLGLTYFTGFKHQRAGFAHTLNQTIDTVAVGAVASTVVLLALNRISLGDPLDSILGKIIVQTVPLSIGAAVANAVFAPGQSRHSQEPGLGAGDAGGGSWRATLNDLGATVAGGIFVGFSVAPTEEIPLLARSLDYPHALALIGLSLVLTYGIVFASGFDPDRSAGQGEGPFQRPVTETVVAYLVSLLVALAALILFNQIAAGDPLADIVAQTLVLGLATGVGGAAGRLVI
ncbi:MAG: TIGR02587 family membrane protein [Chloroflexota bacterium]|nr:TIGR02587 family membrane protein [Chloroflexota bacterium]